MHRSATFTSQPRLWRHMVVVVLVIGAVYLVMGAAADAQNIDQGKSAKRLFSDTCATCHRNPRGLAKGRFRVTLFLFLKDHYSSDSSAAWELTSYLESLDTPKRVRSKTAAAKPPSSSTSRARSSFRPPMPVPQR